MATFSKQAFTGNTKGSSVLVAATSATGTVIHTVPSAVLDEVWVYGTNNDVSSINLTMEYGDVSGSNNINMSIPAKSGLTIIVPGLILSASQVVRAYAGTANQISLFGYVNRIT